MERLDDRAAITEQMFVYARATDWLETENHRRVFVDDCVFASPHSGDMHGVDAVVEWMDRVLAQFEATQHLIGNISITFTGGDTATAVSYVRAWHRFVDHVEARHGAVGRVPRQLGRASTARGASRSGGCRRPASSRVATGASRTRGARRHEARRRLPAERAARRPGGLHEIGPGGRVARLRQPAVLRPRGGRRARRPRATAVGPVHGAGLVPRPVRRLRIPRRDHLADRARDGRHDPPAAADGARCPAGCRRGPAVARAAAARRRHRMELGRVRRPGQRLRDPGRPTRRADRCSCAGCGRNHWSRSTGGSTGWSAAASTPGPGARSRSGSAGSARRPSAAAGPSATASRSRATRTTPWPASEGPRAPGAGRAERGARSAPS